jgi:hypothetical protein
VSDTSQAGDDAVEALDRILLMLLEDHYYRRAIAYLFRIARSLRVIPTTQFMDLLEDAFDEGRLTDNEWSDLRLAPVVLSGRHRTDGRDLYILVHVALAVDTGDVERAIQRTSLLERLGWPVIPVVAGRRITSEAATMAHERGVWYAGEGRLTAPRSA